MDKKIIVAFVGGAAVGAAIAVAIAVAESVRIIGAGPLADERKTEDTTKADSRDAAIVPGGAYYDTHGELL